MGNTTPHYYLLLRDFLAPWAQKFGALSDDWKQELFEDLVGGDSEQAAWAPVTGTHGERMVELFGYRFRCRAVPDERRKDTLFVIEIRRRDGIPTDTHQIRARWSLARGDRWLPIQTPLGDTFTLPANASTRSANLEMVEEELRRIAGQWPVETVHQFLPSLEAPAPLELLGRIRALFQGDLYGVAGLVTQDIREQNILNGVVSTPSDVREVHALHAHLGMDFLQRVQSSRPELLERVVQRLARLPPPTALTGALVTAWVEATKDVVKEKRISALSDWLASARDEHVRDTALHMVESVLPGVNETLIGLLRGVTSTSAGANTVVGSRPIEDASNTTHYTEEVRPTHGESLVEGAMDEVMNLAPQEVRSDGTAEATREFYRARFFTIRTRNVSANRPQLFSALEAMTSTVQKISLELGNFPTSGTIVSVSAALSEIARRATEASALLPAEAEAQHIDADVDAAVEQWSRHQQLWGARGWLDLVDSWDNLCKTLELLRVESLGILPAWYIQELAPSETDPRELLLYALAQPVSRADIMRTLEWLKSLHSAKGELPEWIRKVGRAEGASPHERLRAAYENHVAEESAGKKLRELVLRIGGWASQLEPTAELGISDLVTSLEGLLEHMETLGARAPHLREGLQAAIASLGGLKAAHDHLDEIDRWFNAAGDLLPGLPSMDMVRRVAERLTGTNERAVAHTTLMLSVNHCISEGGGGVRAARLVARADPSLSGLLLVDVPFALKSNRRQALELQFDIAAPHMQGRPTEWRQKLSGRVVTIAESAWFEHEGAFLTSFVVDAVPVTSARVDGTTLKNFTLKLVGRDVQSTTPFVSPDFEFERPVDDMPPMELPTGDTTSPGEMRQHPLGVQVHFDRLVQVARTGRSSFLVAAPRRFGKTTLLTALIDTLKEADVVAIKPVTAVEQSGAKAFLEACNRLGEMLGSHVPTEWFSRGQLVPDENTFDAARRQAHALGKRAIYLLFDESQYLFVGKNGKQFAEMLKARIENEWGRPSQSMVPIRLGLVGQYHLRRMIAGQLDGVFAEHQIIEREIRSELIEKLVRESTRGAMQSTADARRVLAKVSGNLYILRFLLQELRDQLIADRRTWFVRQDVERAIDAQIERATKAGGSLAAYIRDPLNASDSLTEWQPTSAYPVAIAWAVVSGEPLGRLRRLVRARELLEGWAREFGSWTIQSPRIEQALSELRDAGVLADEDDRYNSRLLQRYLESLGQREAPFREEAERRALQTLVVDQVRLPDGLQEIGRGGQATVSVGMIEDRQSAIRLVWFANESARQDFVETCHALKAIEGTRRRTSGYDALPIVRYAGFTDDVNPQGVIVYDWLPGKDFNDNLGKLSEIRVVSIGRPLAEALRVLSQRRIVHRDIKPENVILRPDGTPVLIDFGLAKLLEHSPDTQFQLTEFLAPEVRHERPNWTSQADVYALSQTLLKLLSTDEGSSLRPLLKEAMHPDPSRRLTADLFAEKLSALADRLNLEGMRQREETAVRTELTALNDARIRELAERHLAAMVSVRAGFFRDVDALSLVAQFLDDVFGHWCRQTWPGSTSPIGNPHLSNLESFINIQGRQPREDRNKLPPELQRLCSGEIVCCGFLRHVNSHADLEHDMLKKAKRHLPPGSDVQQFRAAVQRTGERLAEVLKIPGLATVTRAWVASIKR